MVLLPTQSSTGTTTPARGDKFTVSLLECDGVVIVRGHISQQHAEIRMLDLTIAP